MKRREFLRRASMTGLAVAGSGVGAGLLYDPRGGDQFLFFGSVLRMDIGSSVFCWVSGFVLADVRWASGFLIVCLTALS